MIHCISEFPASIQRKDLEALSHPLITGRGLLLDAARHFAKLRLSGRYSSSLESTWPIGESRQYKGLSLRLVKYTGAVRFLRRSPRGCWARRKSRKHCNANACFSRSEPTAEKTEISSAENDAMSNLSLMAVVICPNHKRDKQDGRRHRPADRVPSFQFWSKNAAARTNRRRWRQSAPFFFDARTKSVSAEIIFPPSLFIGEKIALRGFYELSLRRRDQVVCVGTEHSSWSRS